LILEGKPWEQRHAAAAKARKEKQHEDTNIDRWLFFIYCMDGSDRFAGYGEE
jgi:hypothetical protein